MLPFFFRYSDCARRNGVRSFLCSGEGPVFAHPVQDEAAVKALAVPDMEEKLGYVTAAVRSIRRALDNRVPLIGFSGSPFTLACYMVEGRGSRDFRTAKTMMFRRPDLSRESSTSTPMQLLITSMLRLLLVRRLSKFSIPGAEC